MAERRAGRLAAVVATAAALAAACVAGAPRVMAGFLDGATATPTFTAATLQPPSSLTSGLCLLGSVTMSWTASPSAWADGYELRWGTANGGPYPNSTTTAATSKAVSGLGLLGTYYFVVRAYDGNWRSANSNQRTVSCV